MPFSQPKSTMLMTGSYTHFCPDFSSSLLLKSTITTKYINRSKHPCLTLNSRASYSCDSVFSNNTLSHTSFSSRNRELLLVPFVAKNGGPGEDDRRALETVLRLYSALKHQNLRELSDVIGDECRCVCNFISCFYPFQGKKQVLELLSFLMRTMGDNNIEFVVQPTLQGGMQVAVRWKLEWQNTDLPLGKGFSFYTCHAYQGKVVISNMEMFMEPLVHIEPLRLKMMGLAMSIFDKIGSYSIIKVKGKRAMHLIVTLIIVVSLVCLLRIYFF